MASLAVAHPPGTLGAKAKEYEPVFDQNLNGSYEDVAEAEAVFGDSSEPFSKLAEIQASPACVTSAQIPIAASPHFVAHHQVDPASAVYSDAPEPSNTAAGKFSESLNDIAEGSNAPESTDHEKDLHGATSTRVQVLASTCAYQFTYFNAILLLYPFICTF